MAKQYTVNRDKVVELKEKTPGIYTMTDLARKAGLVPQSLFVIFRRGYCSEASGEKLAEALGVSPADLSGDAAH